MVFEDLNLFLSPRARGVKVEETQVFNLGFIIVTSFGSMHRSRAGSFG